MQPKLKVVVIHCLSVNIEWVYGMLPLLMHMTLQANTKTNSLQALAHVQQQLSR